jgi:hypothetical protein
MILPSGREPHFARGTIQSDLLKLYAAANHPATTPEVFARIDAIAQIGLEHRFCTIMRLHEETLELERVHSSRPAEYPCGGRKSKRGLPWAEQVLIRREPFVGWGAEALQWAFDDHMKLFGLGLGSVINTPIVWDGRCLGTFNLLHEPGWYQHGDEQFTKALAYLLAPAMLALEAAA